MLQGVRLQSLRLLERSRLTQGLGYRMAGTWEGFICRRRNHMKAWFGAKAAQTGFEGGGAGEVAKWLIAPLWCRSGHFFHLLSSTSIRCNLMLDQVVWCNQILYILQQILSLWHGLIVTTPDLHHHLWCRWLPNQLSRLLSRRLLHLWNEILSIRALIRLLSLHQGLPTLVYKFCSKAIHFLGVKIWP